VSWSRTAIFACGVPQFASDWRDAAKVGAERGRHEPAKDALLHLGVVEPVAAGGPTVQIAIGCVPPGIPAPEADVRSTLTPPPKPSSEGD